MKAKDLMTPSVFAVTPDTTIRQVVDLFAATGISGVPVIEGERLVGIVSEGDLLRRHEIGTDRRSAGLPWWMRVFRRPHDAGEYVKSHATRAADVMTTPVISVQEETPASRIASLFEEHGIRRVPVLEDGRVVGIVTRANLVQAVALAAAASVAGHGDRSIRSALLDELSAQEWWHGDSNVLVEDGVVHFWGVYEDEEAKHAARVAAENVPGVREIVDHRISGASLPTMG
jgi:CBS domain-containing protein